MKKTPTKPKARRTAAPRKISGPTFAPAKPLDLLVRQEFDDEIYVMHVKRHQKHYFVIDGLAAQLWASFDGKTTVEEHIEILAREHKSVPPAKVKKDVVRFLAALKKLGLVA